MTSEKILQVKYRGWAARVLSAEAVVTPKRRSMVDDLLKELLSDSIRLYFIGKLTLETLLEDVHFWCRAKKVEPIFFIQFVTFFVLNGKRSKRIVTGRKLKHGVYFNKLICDYVDQARDKRRESGGRGGRDEDCKAAARLLRKEFGETLTLYAIRNIYQRQKLSKRRRKHFS